jgi:hypothetical protein
MLQGNLLGVLAGHRRSGHRHGHVQGGVAETDDLGAESLLPGAKDRRQPCRLDPVGRALPAQQRWNVRAPEGREEPDVGLGVTMSATTFCATTVPDDIVSLRGARPRQARPGRERRAGILRYDDSCGTSSMEGGLAITSSRSRAKSRHAWTSRVSASKASISVGRGAAAHHLGIPSAGARGRCGRGLRAAVPSARGRPVGVDPRPSTWARRSTLGWYSRAGATSRPGRRPAGRSSVPMRLRYRPAATVTCLDYALDGQEA